MFKVSFCFPSSLRNGKHHLALDAWSEENGKKQSCQWEANCPSTWSDRENFQQNQLHLWNFTQGAWRLFYTLTCKIFQALEPPHTLSSMWTWLQVLLSSQARQRECFASLSGQSSSLTPNQSSCLKMSQSMQSPSHHLQQCPKYWKLVNLVITGNGCDCKGLERAQGIWEKRRKKNNAAPSFQNLLAVWTDSLQCRTSLRNEVLPSAAVTAVTANPSAGPVWHRTGHSHSGHWLWRAWLQILSGISQRLTCSCAKGGVNLKST